VGSLADIDNLFARPDLAIWSHVEVGVALTASSIATIRPLLVKLTAFTSYVRSEGLDLAGKVQRAGSRTPLLASTGTNDPEAGETDHPDPSSD
jgi:hypothetical protein